MRLIDADALKQALELKLFKMSIVPMRYVWETINDAPTIDAVEVVRCCECGHCEAERKRNGEVYFYRCGFFDIEIEPQDFFSYGERR